MPVCGYEGRYEISDDGIVRSLRARNKQSDRVRVVPLVLKQQRHYKGYMQVQLAIGCQRINHMVHRLMLESFLGQQPTFQAAHLNGDPSHNVLDNLAWVTPAENEAHKKIHGRALLGEKANAAKLNEHQVHAIRHMYGKGMTMDQVAHCFNVSQSCISAIIRRKSWSYVS